MHNLLKLKDISDRALNLSRAIQGVPEPFPYLAVNMNEHTHLLELASFGTSPLAPDYSQSAGKGRL